ncbi:sodium:proton antiporter [Roseicyclus sp. F158]|uniref:Sodium:proton antiporter n=1 Tax=Tropicimonas omnivorans TaxID=3075590 RepID=A0ABU3DJ46_9RHOB|nr:sodium:proton antiporter [Roseicyclus sp. F158]MDT0683741.1 sodium:proton antiporter [Roseicyclus sp. F158]
MQGTLSEAAMAPIMAFALVGALGVGAQWIAWRLRLPAIVLMLLAGLLIGPVFGVFDPERDIGPLMQPMVAIAVAIILFEGGLTLNIHSLRDAALGVRRLVVIGAPLGWLLSALALHYVAGLGWAAASVFGGIMIVTGPTVIAPLLRTARLARRPAQLLQWEAIVNDPIGALAAVLALELVVVLDTAESFGVAAWDLAFGIGVACILGAMTGWILAFAFKRGFVPEFMKVPVLFAFLLVAFGLSDFILHESGLLAVTVMGVVVANANLASYTEMRRFKEHATILLVSGVFILLAANLEFSALALLDWRAAALIAVVIFVARPLTVLVSLLKTPIPMKERLLVAFTGPRGVVLVAVAGLFGERLSELGFEDGARIGPLAFALVAATVVLHGFTLRPVARWLGLAGGETVGVALIGGSAFSVGFAEALKKADVPVLIADPNRARLRGARAAGLPTFFGDILSESAEYSVEIASYGIWIAATDNDAYNTLVTTDMGPELGREFIFQLRRVKQESSRHALPATLGGQTIAGGRTYTEVNALIAEGWSFRVTRLTEEFTLDDWSAYYPGGIPLARIMPGGDLRILTGPEDEFRSPEGTRLVALVPPEEETPQNDSDTSEAAE